MKHLKFLVAALAFAVLFTSCKKDDPSQTSYAITITNDGNGMAVAAVDGIAATTATMGQEVTLTATPNSGYIFKQWVAVNGTLPTFVEGSTTTTPVTFTMPEKAVSIKAEFEAGVQINGVIWSQSNVDAFGTFTNKAEDYGLFYQWNRTKGWSTTGDVNEWDSTNPIGTEWEADNDPCPTGWRLPTKEEQSTLLDEEKVETEWTTLNGINGMKFTDKATKGTIFLPAVGYRAALSGKLYSQGDVGAYWSSSQDLSESAWYLSFNSTSKAQVVNYKFGSSSVRCVRQ